MLRFARNQVLYVNCVKKSVVVLPNIAEFVLLHVRNTVKQVK